MHVNCQRSMETFTLPICQNEPMVARVMLPWKSNICFAPKLLYQLLSYILRIRYH